MRDTMLEYYLGQAQNHFERLKLLNHPIDIEIMDQISIALEKAANGQIIKDQNGGLRMKEDSAQPSFHKK